MRKLIWVELLFAALPGVCLGQTTEHAWDNLQQLRVGEKIEVVDMKLKSLKGTFVGFSEVAISLRVKNDDLTVPREEVFRVTRQNPKGKRNRVLGIVVGAVGGFAAGMAVAHSKDWLSETGNVSETAAVAGGLAAAGTVAGLAVTSSLGHRTIYTGTAKSR